MEYEDYLHVVELHGIKRTSGRSLVHVEMKRDDLEKVVDLPIFHVVVPEM